MTTAPTAPTAVTGAPVKKRKRVFMWTFLAIQAAFLAAIIGTATADTGVNSTPGGCASLSAETCVAAHQVGQGIGIMLLIGLWVAADVILGIGRLVVLSSRKRAV